MIKNIYLLQLIESSADFLTILWPSAKTYYELNGSRSKEYNWVIPTCEFYQDFDRVKESISLNPPSIFGVSLYVWNYEKSLKLCQWVKETYPDCLVITGGPQQFFKHNQDWFQKYLFIDASLPGEVYGEIAICDILDYLKPNNSIDWNLVEQIAYPSKSRNLILKSKKQTYKREFKWDYAPYHAQFTFIKEYLFEYQQHRENPNMTAKFETSRGCPFNCSFCDWGGGIGTKMIFKSFNTVKQDLDALAELGIKNMWITDSNFGVADTRDLQIVRYILEKNKSSLGEIFQEIGFAGYAKIEKKFDTIKKILKICAKFKLTPFYKISQQSFHEHVLNNIQRVDVSADAKLKLAVYLQRKFKLPTGVEIILGLPGTTVDHWYQEFDKPYQYNLFVTAYEQYVSPGAETYSREYRTRYGLLTTKYVHPDGKFEALELVAGHKDCSRDEYCAMLVIYMCYFFIVQTGVYKQTINRLIQKNNWDFSVFLKKFYEHCYPQLKNVRLDSFDAFEQQLANTTQEIVISDKVFTNNIRWENTVVKYWGFLTVEIFRYSDILIPIISTWLSQIGGDQNLIAKETQLIITEYNSKVKSINWLYEGNYKKYNQIDELVFKIDDAYTTGYGNLLTVDKQRKTMSKIFATLFTKC